MTQPVNKYWLAGTEISRPAAQFFEAGSAPRAADWMEMRDRWERSHVLRSLASAIGLLLLTAAVAS
jgi:hypothetical protein